MNPWCVTCVQTDGKPVSRRFVLPLVGVVVAYHKTTKNYSFSLQIMHSGELKHEFIFAAESEAIMNVWMEVRTGFMDYVPVLAKSTVGHSREFRTGALRIDRKGPARLLGR